MHDVITANQMFRHACFCIFRKRYNVGRACTLGSDCFTFVIDAFCVYFSYSECLHKSRMCPSIRARTTLCARRRNCDPNGKVSDCIDRRSAPNALLLHAFAPTLAVTRQQHLLSRRTSLLDSAPLITLILLTRPLDAGVSATMLHSVVGICLRSRHVVLVMLVAVRTIHVSTLS